METAVEQSRERRLESPEVRRRRPIFMHGMFRTGGTYLWSKVRRSPVHRAYCEPLNMALAQPEEVIRASLSGFPARARHPKTDFYFSEFPFKAQGGVECFDKSFCLHSYALPEDAEHPKLRRYFTHLMTYALALGQVPVFKIDRGLLRTGWLTANFAPLNVLILRKPLDIWESYKSFGERSWFKALTWSFLDHNRSHPHIGELADRYNLPICGATGQFEILDCYADWMREAGDKLYPLFFEFYLLNTLHSARYADCVLDMTGISSEAELKAAATRRLKELRIPVSLEDCRIPSWEQTTAARWEAERIEQRCLDRFEGRLPEEFLVPRGRLELLLGSISGYFREILGRFPAPAAASPPSGGSDPEVSPGSEEQVADRPIGSGRIMESSEMLAEALQHEETPGLWRRWANAQTKNGRHVSAIAGFRRSLELDPVNRSAAHSLNMALRHHRLAVTRVAIRKTLISFVPFKPIVRRLRGRFGGQEGRQ